MGALGWQDATVAVLAVAALAWLVVSRLRRRKGATCEDCPGCRIAAREAGAVAPPPADGAGGTLIPLSALTRRER